MTVISGKPMFSLTEEEKMDLDARTKEREAKIAEEKKTAAFFASGINEDSFNARLGNFVITTEEHQRLNETVVMMIYNTGLKTLVMCGKNGTGKTWAAACVLHELGGKYRKSIEICSEYEDASKPYARETKRKVLERYTAEPFLVIDEVCRTPHSYEREVISYIVADRIENNKKTIIIGNCTAQELQKVLDAAVMSRIKASGLLIELTGQDRRSMK